MEWLKKWVVPAMIAVLAAVVWGCVVKVFMGWVR